MTTPPHPQHGTGAAQHAPTQQPYGQGYTHQTPIGTPTGLAAIGSRLGARVLDLITWYVAYLVPVFPVVIWIDHGGGALARTLLFVWLLASFVLYFPFAIWKFGSTLGKRIFEVRIVRCETARRVGFWRAFGREMFWMGAFFIPVLSPLNALWCCWDKPWRQCLHDKVADTMAVGRKASDPAYAA
ncbi:RDD family protein [Streptomyces montanus]|uniref:RDD family protein n=1 Tax=Streptomyces montanus TaxID=2580423 RepID=A0A5R9FRX7_9ACTN|nr:RDD family protein [Streptomyces montanus]TLS46131.1 RDD family protein [Streptomyces montanus]